jgi:hypothetical protein
VPVLLAAAFLGLPWRTFVVANAPACALWAVVYAGVGVAGGSIFPEPWQSVVAAVIVILIVNQSISWWQKRRAARAAEPSAPSESSGTLVEQGIAERGSGGGAGSTIEDSEHD